jgi:hypothetical protein
MKIGQVVPGAKGSFGIPPELKAQGDRLMSQSREEYEADETRRPNMTAYSDDEPSVAQSEPVQEAPEEGFKIPTPEESLARIGINLNDDDYHSIVFRGVLEKEVCVLPAMGKTRELRATIRTLKTKEYDAIDELLADDIKGIPMTNDGFTSRRSLWILAFAVVKLDGKPLSKPVMTTDDNGTAIVDIKRTAKERKDNVLGELSPIIINELIATHAALTTNMEVILRTNKGEYLKKLSPHRGA